jgi:hypothetical protein
VHRSINLRLAGGSALIVAACIAVGALKIQYAAAQVDATSSDVVATSSESGPTVGATSTTENPIDNSTATAATQASGAASGLVEVQLQCSQSYTADLYDTPSGHPDPYVKPEIATTTDTNPRVVGQQSYTVCHDARGNVHEFPISAAEYAALSVRGTPQKSVMETPDQAALDAFPVEATSSAASDTSASPEPTSSTPTPEVLGASTSATDAPSDTSSAPATSANPVPPDTSSTSTTSAPASSDTGSPSASTTADLPTDTTAPATTSEDSTTPPVTNDNASDASQPPTSATTTDTPSI